MTQRGVTLMELIISFSIVLLICLFVLNLFPSALMAMHRSEVHLQAQRTAEIALERCRAARFDTYAPDSHQVLTDSTLNGIVFHPVLDVLRSPGYDPNLYKGLQVTVTWSDDGYPKNLVDTAWIRHE